VVFNAAPDLTFEGKSTKQLLLIGLGALAFIWILYKTEK